MATSSHTAAPPSRFGGIARRTASRSILKVIADAATRAAARIVNAATAKSPATTRAAALALGLLLTPPLSDAIDAITGTTASFVQADIGHLSFMPPARGQPVALTTSRAAALNA